jgi:hypothetical protein
MGVVVGQLDVLAAPPPVPPAPPEDPPSGPSPVEIEQVLARLEARTARREAD